ncbi:hypothetical protein HDU84_001741 [Entophlyctis sp. JEL0112]|nr:hypothetical protein HDU84_001741 [Entophlyctis sp. JEL0112]
MSNPPDDLGPQITQATAWRLNTARTGTKSKSTASSIVSSELSRQSSRIPSGPPAQGSVSATTGNAGGGSGASIVGIGVAGTSGAERMRRQLDALRQASNTCITSDALHPKPRKKQIDLAKKHMQIGSDVLVLSADELNAFNHDEADTSKEKVNAKIRARAIQKKEEQINALMSSLEELSDEMTRIHFEHVNSAGEETSKVPEASA